MFVDSAMIHGIVAVVTAVAVGALARGIRPGEAEHLSALLRPVIAVLAIPAVWMLIQAVPMPVPGLANPIWASAAAGLGRSLMGRISVSPDATLLSLARYLAIVGIGLAAMAVSIDRRRAEWMLFWLTGITSLVAGLLVIDNLGIVKFLEANGSLAVASPIAATGVLGTVIAACAAIRAYERYETRRSVNEMTFGKFARAFALSLGAFSICWFALSGRSVQIFAAACATATVVLIEVIRRLGLGRWVGAAIALVAITVASAVAVNQAGVARDLTLRFAGGAPGASVAVAERIMADTRWTGSGAGTFSALTPIYRDVDDADISAAPTTAAAIAIDLGRPLLLVSVLTMIAAAALLLRGALRRGRDSFYPVAGVGCVLALTIEAFTDATALSSAPQIIAATVLGLALAQSVSRTSQ